MSPGTPVTWLAGALAVSTLGVPSLAGRSRRRRVEVALTHSTIALLASAIVGLWPGDASAASFTPIGDLPGGTFASVATEVSADGSTVVGFGASASGQEAFRWTVGGGMVGLGDLASGSVAGVANAVSADGATIVGSGTNATRTEAFLWTASDGMRELDDVRASLGVDPTGWILSEALGVSADGLTIVGYGRNPSGSTEGWIAVIPEPERGALAAVGLACVALRPRRSRPRCAH